MATHPLISAFWRVRGKSLGDTLRLYGLLLSWIVEGGLVKLLPGRLRQAALRARWKRISWQAQQEKVYIRTLGGYHSLIHGIAKQELDFDMGWFQWREGEVGLQIGANRGEYSIIASRLLGPRGLCIAVEPNPGAYLDLLELIALNKATNIVALPVACGSSEGWVELELPGEDWGDGVVRVKAGENQEGRTIAQTRLRRVDGIVQGFGLERCDFLIIDVEGYEGEVLRGADAVLRRFRPSLYIEIHDTWDEIESLLRAYGYGIRAWKGNRPGRGHIWAMPEASG